jgi:hypothetical protein
MKRRPPAEATRKELEADLHDAQEALRRYHQFLEDVFFSGNFTLDEMQRIRHVAEFYGCWIP